MEIKLDDIVAAEHPTVVLHNGEMLRPSVIRARQAVFVTPGIVTILFLLAIPCISLFAVAFMTRGQFGDIEFNFTTRNIERLLGFGYFGWSADNMLILWRSIVVAFVTTALCVALSYPLAFFLASRPAKTRMLWLTVLLIPFWTNLVIRTYAWLLVFDGDMPFARLMSYLGLAEPGTSLYPSQFAVYVGMVSVFLPFVALPLYTAAEKLDWSIVEAAVDLYSSRWRVFRHAILPQTMPGLSVGITLTFVPAMGMFVVPDMLGGARYMLIGNLIQQQFGSSRDWPFGAALSLVLMILTLGALVAVGSSEKKGRRI
ncbi:MAG: ABC transporter permease [Opitutales bacterium]|jgi:spermidine/putrescine transport system permease protein